MNDKQAEAQIDSLWAAIERLGQRIEQVELDLHRLKDDTRTTAYRIEDSVSAISREVNSLRRGW